MHDRDALMRFIEGNERLSSLLGIVEARMDDDPGHDLDHCLRVALWTLRLGAGEFDDQRAVAAALLHDIVNVPKNSPERSRASEKCAQVAREVLEPLGFGSSAVQEICDAIRDHSYSRGSVPTSSLGRCLQDADRLEAVGAIGVMRTISTGVRMNAAYFHGTDPWARERPLDDAAYSVDHFYAKLLRLAPSMLTERGREEAIRRSRFMEAFLAQLGDELAQPPPPSRYPDSGS
ncbi:HD domain-containing protein [Myxococcota bacterium]|nr:HD domain-containing protein [Myxococcota bacterium]